MTSDQIIFAGVVVLSGRKPVTFAVLDSELKLVALEKWSIAESVSCLQDYEKVLLAIETSTHNSAHPDFKKQLVHLHYKPLSKQNGSRQFIETQAQDCFQAFTGQGLLSRRTLEGRIQRALILYEEGFQIPDPMDFFEEITRHKLIQGILPLENLFSIRELNALVAAYVSWMTFNRPTHVNIKGNFILPVRE